MRKKIVAANWKMNMTQAESARFVESLLLRDLGDITDVEVVIIPPFTAIAKVSEALGRAHNIKVGAQNMFWEKSGPFTGEISAPLLRDLLCTTSCSATANVAGCLPRLMKWLIARCARRSRE